MATKIGGLVLTADTTGTVVTAGSNGGTFTVYFNNDTDSAASVTLGLSASANFDSDYKLFTGKTLNAGSQLAFDPIVLTGTVNNVLAESTVTGVNVLATGFDED